MGPPEILPPTAELGMLEPVRALRRSRGANPATRPSSSLILRLRPRVVLDELVGGELEGRYFGVGNIGVVVDIVVAPPSPVPTLDTSTSLNTSCGVVVIFNKVRFGSEPQAISLGS